MSSATPENAGTDVEVRALAAERLTFFSDAVVAIAITLLALELPVPAGVTNADLLHALDEHRSEYIAFLISFVVIGGHWRAHHRLFRYVVDADRGLVELSFGWLLMQILTPFATKVIAGVGGFEVRFTFYSAVQVLAMVMFLVMTWQIRRHGLQRPDTPPELFADANIGAKLMVVAFAVSIPVAFFTTWAYACWIAIPVIGGQVNRTLRRRAASSRA